MNISGTQQAIIWDRLAQGALLNQLIIIICINCYKTMLNWKCAVFVHVVLNMVIIHHDNTQQHEILNCT